MTREEFQAMVKAAQDRYDSMTKEQQKAMWAAQRKSWVIGEFMLSHPEVSREYAEKIYDGLDP